MANINVVIDETNALEGQKQKNISSKSQIFFLLSEALYGQIE